MKHALVIDDSKFAADILCKFLGLLDVSAQAAYGARAAMVAVKELAPDIIFLDINMPGLSGFEVLGFFKREPGTENTPVVVVTADENLQTAENARRQGAVAVMVKPLTLEALEEVLKLTHIL